MSVTGGLSATVLDAMGPSARLSIPVPMMLAQLLVAAVASGSRRRPALVAAVLLAIVEPVCIVSGFFDGGYVRCGSHRVAEGRPARARRDARSRRARCRPTSGTVAPVPSLLLLPPRAFRSPGVGAPSGCPEPSAHGRTAHGALLVAMIGLWVTTPTRNEAGFALLHWECV